jgi:catechol 2,3-dioxygenase-like lactoylglutathione lyase family enzyme
MLARSADLAVDHVTVTGSDLKAMEARLSALGIRYQYGGPHSNHATEMALTSFPDGSYLELMGIQPNADPQAVKGHYWSKQLQGDAGPTAWAVRPKDIAAEVKRLQAAGVTVSEPERSGRARPDGVRLEWEASRVGAEPNGTFFPFLIHDFTPREQRAFPTGKPTTDVFSGVERVVIAVRDLNASIARYRKAYALPAPKEARDMNFDARLAFFTGTPVVLATPLSAASWITARLARIGEGPCAFVLGTKVTTMNRFTPMGPFISGTTRSRWPGASVTWFSAENLGWHLGFE